MDILEESENSNRSSANSIRSTYTVYFEYVFDEIVIF
jgi:hypothetical protein